jgi:glycosyltransferase involved in cell wall biosynthesis
MPVVCYSGPETAWPITEAGILTVPLGDRQALVGALERLLSEDSFRANLAERSRQAQKEYFSWTAIVERFATELNLRREAQVVRKAVENDAIAGI